MSFTKIKDAEKMGSYNSTAVDSHKSKADFLLIQTSPYIIRWRLSGTCEQVSESKLKRMQEKYNWATEF